MKLFLVLSFIVLSNNLFAEIASSNLISCGIESGGEFKLEQFNEHDTLLVTLRTNDRFRTWNNSNPKIAKFKLVNEENEIKGYFKFGRRLLFGTQIAKILIDKTTKEGIIKFKIHCGIVLFPFCGALKDSEFKAKLVNCELPN